MTMAIAAHELARHIVAEHHLQHGQNGGQGGHQDRTHTGLAGGDKGRTALQTAQTQLIGVVHEDDTVVDDGTHQDDEAHQGDHGQLLAGDQHTQQAAGEGQRHGKQDDEGDSRLWH